MKPSSTVAQQDGEKAGPEIQASFRIPGLLWKRVRNLATERVVSQQSLWIQAMTEFLDRQSANDAEDSSAA
jgi:predicted transcriptional regulator